jgi:putative transcriptional regulator
MNTHSDAGADLLLRHAAGHLDAGFSLLVETHLALSPASRRLHGQFEALGGALLEEMTPADVDPAALNRALCAIDRESGVAGTAKRHHPPRHPKMPEGFALPAPLAEADIQPWRWIAPGVRSARVALPESAVSRAFLLEIASGVRVPRHGHDGDEATCVLRGGFSDGVGHYGPGDIAHADEHVEHVIEIDPESPCLCLIAMEGRTRPHSWLGRLYQQIRDI